MFVVEPNNLLNNWSDFRPFHTQKHPCGITAMEIGHPMETWLISTMTSKTCQRANVAQVPRVEKLFQVFASNVKRSI